MAELDLMKPSLYRREGTERVPHSPALLGGRCGQCGYVFFPRKSYGCEKCGSVDLSDKALSGRGTLVAAAEVHMHAGKGREAPFIVCSVTLDDGPVVRTLLASDKRPPIGTAVRTVLVPVTHNDERAEDLRFEPEA